MADIDLIPADYAKLAQVRRRLKPLLAALIAVVVLVGAARAALYLLMSFENVGIARLQKDSQASARTRAEADRLRQQKLVVEKQLAELDELRGRDRVRLLLRAIDAAHSDSVWIDQLNFFRRDIKAGDARSATPGARPTASAVPAPAAEAGSVEQRAEIVGHATDHTRLAEFMQKLSGQPGIAEVRLVDTGLGSYARTPVIDLTLSLLIDEKARRAQ